MGFQNTKEIAEFLEKNKPMTKESLAQLKILSQQQQPPIHLYRMATFTKALFLVSRYQVYFYCIAQGFTGYTLYSLKAKYEQILERIRSKDDTFCRDCGFLTTLSNLASNPDDDVRRRVAKLAALAGFTAFSSVLGLLLTLKMGKLMPTNIFLHMQSNQLEIRYFNLLGFQKSLMLPTSSIERAPRKKGLINATVQFQIKKGGRMLTKGPGTWSNISLLDLVLTQ